MAEFPPYNSGALANMGSQSEECTTNNGGYDQILSFQNCYISLKHKKNLNHF